MTNMREYVKPFTVQGVIWFDGDKTITDLIGADTAMPKPTKTTKPTKSTKTTKNTTKKKVRTY